MYAWYENWFQAHARKLWGERYDSNVRKIARILAGILFLVVDELASWRRRNPGSGGPAFVADRPVLAVVANVFKRAHNREGAQRGKTWTGHRGPFRYLLQQDLICFKSVIWNHCENWRFASDSVATPKQTKRNRRRKLLTFLRESFNVRWKKCCCMCGLKVDAIQAATSASPIALNGGVLSRALLAAGDFSSIALFHYLQIPLGFAKHWIWSHSSRCKWSRALSSYRSRRKWWRKKFAFSCKASRILCGTGTSTVWCAA